MIRKQIPVLVALVAAFILYGCSGSSADSPEQVAKMKAALENKHQPTLAEEKENLAKMSPQMRAKVVGFIPHAKQVELGLISK